MKLRHLLVVCSVVGALGGGSLVANAQGNMPEWVAGNGSYIMTLHIGPAEDMITQDQSAAGMGGEVLARPGPGGLTVSMPPATALLNQSMAPNHHIGVQIDRRGTLNPVTDIAPSFLVMNQVTGETQRFDNVPAMFDANMGANDYHYGVNAYIPDGLYTISVLVGNQRLSFQDVSITGGGAATAPAVPVAPAITTGGNVPAGGALAPILPVGTDSTYDFANQTTEAQRMITEGLRNATVVP